MLPCPPTAGQELTAVVRLSSFVPTPLELNQNVIPYIVRGPDGGEAAVEPGDAAEEVGCATDQTVEIKGWKEPWQPLAPRDSKVRSESALYGAAIPVVADE